MTTKNVKAKEASKWAQIVAAVWIAGWSTYKFMTGPFTIQDIIISGLGVAACFTPTVFSIFLDKVRDINVSAIEKRASVYNAHAPNNYQGK